MSAKKLIDFLDSHHIKYTNIPHPQAFTAEQVAESAHVSGKEMAKTVIVKLDGKLAMVVLPSNIKVDLEALKIRTHTQKAELAHEYEFKDKFPECELGAMPPFGNLFGLEVYVDAHLAKDKEIAFNAGTHSELIRLAYKDFAEWAHPTML